MSASYLIDGYNLLHALGMLQRRVGPGGLEKARLSLLGLLHGAFSEQSSQITVVFDASGASAGASAEADYHGIHIRYALGRQQADDVIEEIVQHEGAPQQLTVVSDDHRLQRAARRRHAHSLTCTAFLDVLEQQRRKQASVPPPAEKQEKLSAKEKELWLKEFGDLEKDPEFKEFFELF
jgi:predicted RNA-binding protein with PIN domain